VQRPIRVLSLIKGLSLGGAERLLSLMAEFRDRDAFRYEAAYLLPWKDGLVDQFQADGVPVHCLEGGREWDIRWVSRLRRLVRDRRYDVVHVHSPYVAGLARLGLKSLSPRLRPRLVYTEHLPWWGYRRPTRLLNRLTYRLDDANLAVSRTVRESVHPRLRHRVDVVIHGIAPQRIREHRRHRDDVRRELGVKPGEILVGTVAHLTRQKGYPVLLEAAQRLVERGLPVRFMAVGRGPEEVRIRETHERLALGDRFQFLGFRPDAIRLMSAFDIFVLASWYEGLPVTVMEALTLGIPPVATRVGGTPEVITSGVEGLLVPPGRPDELGAAIASLARAPDLRREMSRAAMQRASTFDIEAATRKVEATYRSVMIPHTEEEETAVGAG
jgi:glycosyltransferase involved in cell wall biosynthesis